MNIATIGRRQNLTINSASPTIRDNGHSDLSSPMLCFGEVEKRDAVMLSGVRLAVQAQLQGVDFGPLSTSQ